MKKLKLSFEIRGVLRKPKDGKNKFEYVGVLMHGDAADGKIKLIMDSKILPDDCTLTGELLVEKADHTTQTKLNFGIDEELAKSVFGEPDDDEAE